MKKTRADVKSYIYFCIEISSTIDQKSTKKSRTTSFATEPIEKAFLGAHFFAKKLFLVDLGVPEETPKLAKMGEGH